MAWNSRQTGTSSVLRLSGAEVFNLLQDAVNVCLGFTAWNPVPKWIIAVLFNSWPEKEQDIPQAGAALAWRAQQEGEPDQWFSSFMLPSAGNDTGGWIHWERGQRTGDFKAHIPRHCHLVSSVLGEAGFRFECQLEQKTGLALQVAVCNCVELKKSLQTTLINKAPWMISA